MRAAAVQRHLGFSFFMLLVAGPLHADEELRCNANTPCPENYVCEHAAPPPTDPSGPGTNPPPPPEEEDGFCIYVGDERTCTSNEDCDASEYCEMMTNPGCSAPPCPPGETCAPTDCGGGAGETVGRCVQMRPDAFHECESDEDCPSGFTCNVQMLPCPAPDCGPNQDCPPADCPAESVAFCEWTPSTCADDSDCGEGEFCHVVESSECTGATSPCEIGENGEVICEENNEEDVECESQTESYCLPRYLLSCEEDADCGEGFSCEAVEVCSCSASGGSTADGMADSEDAPADDMTDECSCETTDEGYCALQDIPCTSNDACPSGLVCVFESDAGESDVVCATDTDAETCEGAPAMGAPEPPENGEEDTGSGSSNDTGDDASAGSEDRNAGGSDDDVPALGHCAPPYASGGDGGSASEQDYDVAVPPADPNAAVDEGDGNGGASPLDDAPRNADTTDDDNDPAGGAWGLNCSSFALSPSWWMLGLIVWAMRTRRTLSAGQR